MRTIGLIAVLSFFTLTTEVKAQVFGVNPLVTITAAAVTAQIYNPYYEPILCEGLAFGQTFVGTVQQARVADIIPPAGYRFAVVSTNPIVNPFVNGWAQVLCRFLR
ncbi:MAG: hypothetical protein K2P81_14235 [Bacteriovoracaceae bacterium]|nr:hypothetical protein [Bacteriovoracaceae bacterium]